MPSIPLAGPTKKLIRRQGGSRKVVLREDVAVKRERTDANRNKRHSNPNALEWANYQKYFKDIPAELHQNFAPILRFFLRLNGRSRIIALRVKNADGSHSKSLNETGPVHNTFFWDNYHRMMEWMISRRIFLYDFNPKNFYVKWINQKRCIPVLVDYKIIGATTHPLQPWLHIPFFGARKMRRRMVRFEKRVKDSIEQSPGMRELPLLLILPIQKSPTR